MLSVIMLIPSINYEGLGLVIILLVSSANRTGFNESAVTVGRSFI
jgi:hypothetical protein